MAGSRCKCCCCSKPAQTNGVQPVNSNQLLDETKETKPVSVLKLFRYSTPIERCLLILGLVAAIIGGLGIPATIVLFGDITNAFVDQKTGSVNDTSIKNISLDEIDKIFHDRITKFGIQMIVVGSIQLVCSYIMVTSLNMAAERQVFRIRTTFLHSVLRQDMQWYDTHKVGDFATVSIENLNKLEDGIGEKIGMIVYFMVNFLASIIIAFVYGWKLTLVILSVTPVLVVSTSVFAKLQTSLTSDETKAYGKAGVVAEETFSSIRTVVAFGGEEKMMKNYEENLVFARQTGMKRGLITGLGSAVTWFIIYGSYALAFWYGVTLILDSNRNGTNEYNPGVLLIVFFSAIMGAMNIGQSAPYVEALATARASAATIYEIIEKKPEIDSSSPKGENIKIEGNVEFNHLYFSYPSRPDVPILNGLSLTVNKGQCVALVGSSGCGKSTLIQLLQRFYDPDKGDIKIDGYNVRDLNVRCLRNHIGVVSQEPVLFGLSIRENICLGRDNVTQEDIETAAKAANAHDFIMKLPLKYETMVGERGAQLSGGQKQRIAITRALVRNPSILLLDEATSALDTQSEATVQAALEKAGSGRTTIVVAHRLSTVRNADKIVAIDKGVVKETGTHDELMELKGLYYQLVISQAEAESKSKDDEHDESDNEENDMIPSKMKRLESNKSQSVEDDRRISVVVNQPLKDKEETHPALWEIMKLNSPEWIQILVGCIGSTAFGCTTPCYALLFGEIMRVLSIQDPDKASEESIFYSCLFLAIGAWAGISCFLQMYMFAAAGEKLTMRLRRIAFKAILRQEISWFDSPENSTGALCARLATDASNVQGATGSRVGVLLQTFGALGISLILALVLVWKQALVSVAMIPLVFVGTYTQAKLMSGQSLSDMETQEEAGKIAIEAITNIRTVASLCKEETFCAMYEKKLLQLKNKATRRNHIRGLLFGFSQSIPMMSYSASLWYGGSLIISERVPYQDVFKVGELLIFGTMMVGQSIAFAPNYNKGLISAGRIFSLLNRKPAIDREDDTGTRLAEEDISSLEFRSVKFSYPTRQQVKVLKDLNMKIEAGQNVALVGSSGCGKSTCIQLLERFYDPSKGAIMLADQTIQSLNLKYLRSCFGLVSQEPVLFDCSIAENIAYGDNTREVTMQEIIEASKKANIHNFITTLPQGYDTNVGSKGTQMSGGQKQRIAIARALVRNPKILLLDEATSALDTESEKVVQEALDQAMIGRTSIVIAHRLTTVQNVDNIFVFHQGQVAEQGTHQELLARKGIYYNLHNTQIT